MKILTLRHMIFAAALAAPFMLGGCVVEPNGYYQQSQAVYAEPGYYAAPAYYYGGPSVYIGGGCCYGGGGWRGGYGGGWHR